MRIKVTMNSVQQTSLELNYNYYVSSMIYKLLQKSDSEYSQKLHEEGYMCGGKKFKLFTFSNIFPQNYRRKDNILILKGRTILYISSPKREFVLHLAEGLLSTGKVGIAGSEFVVETVEILPEPEFEREMHFTCLSPISCNTVKVIGGKKKAVPCIPGTFKFSENIKNNLLRKYNLLYGKLPQDMSLEMEFNKRDLDRYGRGKLIRFKEAYIKAYAIPFTLRGSTELMKVGYDCGFGDKNSAGCGMAERR